MTTEKMQVQEQGGINWTWFKVQNGKLVAVFRLHYGEEPLIAFRKLQKKMVKVDEIDVPMATWREKCDLIASHTGGKGNGYLLPEVVDAFSWLNDMFKGVADDFELNACQGIMRHLEYHGVAIVRLRR